MFLTRILLIAFLLIGLLSGLSSSPSEASWKPPLYQGEAIEVIDIHSHIGDTKTMGPLGKEFLYSTLPRWMPKRLKDWSLEAMANLVLKPYTPMFGVKQECFNAGLSMCGLMAVYAPLTWGTVTNDEIISVLRDQRNRGPQGELWYFFGLASVNVHRFPDNTDEELAQLRRSLAQPMMKGIKLAFVHNELPMDDLNYDGIYEVAREFGVPVYHHIGSSPLRKMKDFKTDDERKKYLRSSDPSALEWAIARHPDVPFILGHMGFDFNREGFDFTDEVYHLAQKYPNVYLEISAFGLSNYDPDGTFMDAALSRLRDLNLLNRTLYGSDASGQPGAVKAYVQLTLASMARVGFTPEQVRAVMALNTRQLFKLN
jgi:predicted TIM-barrel fold metal-dependent hydrolase